MLFSEYIKNTLNDNDLSEKGAAFISDLYHHKRVELLTDRFKYKLPAAAANWHFDRFKESSVIIFAPGFDEVKSFMTEVMVQRSIVGLRPQVEKWRLRDENDNLNHFMAAGTWADMGCFSGRKEMNAMWIVLDADHAPKDVWCVLEGHVSGENHYVIAVNRRVPAKVRLGIRNQIKMDQ